MTQRLRLAAVLVVSLTTLAFAQASDSFAGKWALNFPNNARPAELVLTSHADGWSGTLDQIPLTAEVDTKGLHGTVASRAGSTAYSAIEATVTKPGELGGTLTYHFETAPGEWAAKMSTFVGHRPVK
jgi:hypothetical protein